MGQPSSSVAMDMGLVSVVNNGFPYQISGPPRGCRSAAISVAMLRVMMEGQIDMSPL